MNPIEKIEKRVYHEKLLKALLGASKIEAWELAHFIKETKPKKEYHAKICQLIEDYKPDRYLKAIINQCYSKEIATNYLETKNLLLVKKNLAYDIYPIAKLQELIKHRNFQVKAQALRRLLTHQPETANIKQVINKSTSPSLAAIAYHKTGNKEYLQIYKEKATKHGITIYGTDASIRPYLPITEEPHTYYTELKRYKKLEKFIQDNPEQSEKSIPEVIDNYLAKYPTVAITAIIENKTTAKRKVLTEEEFRYLWQHQPQSLANADPWVVAHWTIRLIQEGDELPDELLKQLPLEVLEVILMQCK